MKNNQKMSKDPEDYLMDKAIETTKKHNKPAGWKKPLNKNNLQNSNMKPSKQIKETGSEMLLRGLKSHLAKKKAKLLIQALQEAKDQKSSSNDPDDYRMDNIIATLSKHQLPKEPSSSNDPEAYSLDNAISVFRKHKLPKKQQAQSQASQLPPMDPQPFDPNDFPTLVKYDSQQIEDAAQELMEQHQMTKQQALVNLEMDLAERHQLATGGK